MVEILFVFSLHVTLMGQGIRKTYDSSKLLIQFSDIYINIIKTSAHFNQPGACRYQANAWNRETWNDLKSMDVRYKKQSVKN